MSTGESGKQGQGDGANASETSTVGTDKTLDSLLDEWGNSSSASPDKTGDVVGRVIKEVKPVIDFARTEAARRANEQDEKDLKSALEFMAEPDEFKEFPEFWMKSYLEGYSADNPAFVDAFAKRGENPEIWKAALNEAREKFGERIKELPGSKVRSDVEAAKAAVSGTSNEPLDELEKSEQEQAAELMDMSEADFQRWQKQEFAKASAGR